MKFDDVLRQIGEFGPYQKRTYFFAAIPAILVAFETLSVIFIFNIPPHRCAIPGYHGDSYYVKDGNHTSMLNHSIPKTKDGWDKCHVFTEALNDVIVANYHDVIEGTENGTVSGNESDVSQMTSYRTSDSLSTCDSWVYDTSIFESTIATDFDVVCDRSVYRPSSNMISEMGTLFGVFICGILADRFGRKIPFYIGGLALIGGGFGIAFTSNLITLNVCRFVLGIARMAVFMNGFVVGMEIVGPSKRVFTGLFIEVLWCVGELLLLLFAYFIRQWRYLEIALSIPSIGLMFYWWLIPESPRWLASRGRGEEALQVLEKIAASNKTQMPKVGETKDLFEADNQFNLRQVFQSRELRTRVLIVYSNMFVIAMVYYGLTLNVTNLGGDIFINFLIMAVLETIGFGVPTFLLDRVGRKPVYCVSILVAGLACVISLFPVMFGAPEWAVIALCMTGRLFVCTAYGVIYVYGAELFPTVIRASAMGTGVTVSRVGSLISPYLADVGILVGGKLEKALPLVVMGSPAILVGLFSLWLPETKGTRLPETLEDLDRFRSKRRCGGCIGKGDEDIKEINVEGEAEGLTATRC